jgi:RNA polymerase-binding transcription factor DksA
MTISLNEKRARHRVYAKNWIKRNPDKHRESQDRGRTNYRSKHRDRVLARLKLQRAVREGKIEKPSHCEDCKAPIPKELLHGHHKSYSEPLQVEWLCASCHHDRHIKEVP